MSWLIQDRNYKDKNERIKNESIFNVSNGYVGVRGNFEEGYGSESSTDTIRGTYINAFYEVEPIQYGEKLHGFPESKQKILNVIDSQTVNLEIDGEEFHLDQGEVLDYNRVLDMQAGTVTRHIHWRSPKGHEVKIKVQRLTSFNVLELFLLNYEITALNFSGEVKVISKVDGSITNYTDETDPRTGGGSGKHYEDITTCVEGKTMQVSTVTEYSHLTATCTVAHVTEDEHELAILSDDQVLTAVITGHLKQDTPFRMTKFSIYTDSRRVADPEKVGRDKLQDVLKKTYSEYLQEQRVYLDNFWSTADILIEGDDLLQQGIRYNMFQLLQSVGKDKFSNIAAKGMSGEGYEGHYFWDTEIYIFPFFLMTQPELAKKLLIYRHSILDAARQRALEVGHHRGALYPWRTISGGECSAFFPAGTAQYHINADIAYAVIQYYMVTGDREFMVNYGAEMLFETARLWGDIGHFYKGQFMIHSVTGPDEYTCVVDNNYYTNSMAKNNMKWAYKVYEELGHEPQVLSIIDKMELPKEEAMKWKEAADNMYLAFDEELGINPQDDTFLSKKIWPLDEIPKEKFPLLLHYHPLYLYRYQICKQADTVLAHFLLEDEQDEATIENSYHYYEKITTHDSSLSFAVFSIMASKVGEEEKAYDYFMKSARLDLDDHHGNTKHGIHTANMGGTYLGIVYGFGGLRIKEDMPSLRPHKPAKWDTYTFKFVYHGRIIRVRVDESKVYINLLEGESLEVKVYDQKVTLTNEETVIPLTK